MLDKYLHVLNHSINKDVIMPRHKKWRGIMLYPPNF